MAFDQVSFGYGRIPVLRDASLRLGSGEFVAVIGGNGSGKSTLLRLGLGLLRPTHGRVRAFGIDVDRFKEWHRIGYVPQRAVAASQLPISVTEVVRSGLTGRLGLWRRPAAADRDRINEVIAMMGLTALSRAPVNRLSGGQQQRALIARALVTRPDLLVLDEPTTGVDSGARHVLRESLEHLVRSDGVSVIYVSHDPEGFAGLADRVVEVRAGRVVDCDNPWAHTHAHDHPPPEPLPLGDEARQP